MLILYNFIHILILILFFPLICIYIGVRAKYRSWIPARLGLGLKKDIPASTTGRHVIWIHALSVGEVTSAHPLVAALKNEMQDVSITFSASTTTGYRLARKIMAPYCSSIIPYPLDLLPVCKYFIRMVKPSLFILVETDFWPNFLAELKRKKLPAILVNGRISQRSADRYNRYSFFFKPLFSALSYLCVQTESDRKKFIRLGLNAERIQKLGNLKYEPVSEAKELNFTIDDREKQTVFIAGSTHPGEEEIIISTYQRLSKMHRLKLIIAPRDIKRAAKIAALAESCNISVQCRTKTSRFSAELLILDTIGELTSFYALGDICFVGGSLVEEGGHNPLEPAYQGKPVIFGTHMDDFEEISQDLIASGGGFAVKGREGLYELVERFLQNPDHRQLCGNAARDCVLQSQGVLRKHLELIKEII